MCDTIVIVGDGEVLFAKNSDRDANEAQVLDWQPRRTHGPGTRLRCTHIDIPQVESTAAVLLSRPFWMWGAEMGANEHGVVIGNEAVFTRRPTADTGLTGMDLLRLALERARTADQAVDVITSLLAEHGQGGGCGYEDRSFTYHNSFLVADHAGARVLETADRTWAVEVVDGVRSISNGLTIDGFADQHSDRLLTRVSGGRIRQPRTESLAAGISDPAGLAAVLRDHGGDDWPVYRRLTGTLAMACMHGGSDIASSLTAGSWLSRLRPGDARHWATGTSSPCLSLFKPVTVDRPVDLGTRPEGTVDDSLWWTHERLHRRVMRDPSRLAAPIVERRDALERRWFADPPDDASAFAEHRHLLSAWLDETPEPATDVRPGFARRYWGKRDLLAGLT